MAKSFVFNPLTSNFDMIDTVTVAAVGSSPNANAATVSGDNVLNLELASASFPGVVSTAAQAFAGKKTFNAGLDAGSNKITSVTDPAAAQDAATKAYVDAGLAALNPKTAVYAATTANLTGTYLNGVAGVGATFTVTATGAFTLDGTTPPVLSRILIKDQSSGFQNGVYDLTVAGSLGVSPILTRSLDYNTAAEMNTAGLIPVINGTVNALSSWQQTAVITTVGTDSLVFQEFTANPSLYLLKANNLNDVASSSTSFNNISGLTTLGDLIYGGASGTRSRLAGNTTSTTQLLSSVGSAGLATAPAWLTATSTNTASAPVIRDSSGNFSAGTITASLSGNATTATTATTATNATNVATTQVSNSASYFPLMVSSSTNGNQACDLGTGLTFNPSTNNLSTTTFTGALTGTASGNTTYSANNHGVVLSSATNAMTVIAPNASTVFPLVSNGTGSDPSWQILAIGGGGTGQSTKAAGFDALQPMTTSGDVIYGGTSGTGTRLAKGSDSQVLTLTSGLPAWQSPGNQAVTSVQTGTYSILTTDYNVLLNPSGGAFTATLPTAVGVTGKVYSIICTATGTSTNLATIATTSSQTIGGNASGAITLCTANEALEIVSDGTNWQIKSWKTETPWNTFTPTGAWSTNTTYTGRWRRVGGQMEIYYKVATSGAPTSASLTVNLPANFTVNTNNILDTSTQETQVGWYIAQDSATSFYPGIITYESTTSVKVRYINSASTPAASSGNVTQAVPFTFGSGDSVQIYASVPVTGFGA